MKKMNVLGMCVCLALMTACGKGGQNQQKAINNKLIVIAEDATFDEKWNPFLAESVYDHAVVDQLFTHICQIDANNELVPYGGNITAENTGTGGVLYTVTIRKGMKYTTGEPITIDDYIWGLYVRADPSYTGLSNLLEAHVEGVESYFYDDPDYSEKLKQMEKEAASRYKSDVISLDDFKVFARGTNLDNWWRGDPAGSAGGGKTWSQYIEGEGFGDKLKAINAQDASAMLDLLAEVEHAKYRGSYDTYTWFLDKSKKDYAIGNISDGVKVTEISGIKKIDDYTCTILTTTIDIYADRFFTTENGAGHLIPRSYYGELTKGDVSKILSNMSPVGSGPFVWQGFNDNIVTCIANKDFFLGAPKIGTVRWQYIPQTEVVAALASGAVDIANPSSSKTNIAEMDRLGITYHLVDNAGFGYMAMNTERVPLYVRKGYWSLMNRGPSVEGYYGPLLASVIERPMTTTLAEYPHDAKPYYPYSKEEALRYFQLAGYSQVNGKLVDKAGKQLTLNTYIGGSGEGNHPAYAMLVQAAEDMRSLGGEVQIQDVAFSVLTGARDDGAADAWIMAWASVFDCDKSSQYHSTGSQNSSKFKDAKMDNLLETIVTTIDLTERRALVAEMLDYAMDMCLELPLYQRKNALAYNPKTLDMSTIPLATSAADYANTLYLVDVKK